MIARPDQLESAGTGPRTGGSATAPARPEAPDPIGSWLDLLDSLLRFPPAEARSIRDELESHLRDLIVTGLSEPQAARAAVDELGDAAAVAREFRAARRTPARRTLMNLGIVGLAAGAMVTSLVAISGGPHAGTISVFQPPAREPQAPRVPVHFSGTQEGSWGEVLNSLAEQAKLPVFVHWSSLRAISADPPIEQEDSVQVRLSGDFTLDSALEFLNDDLGLGADDRIDFRVRDGRVVFASTAFFDRQDTVLATYDLSGLVSRRVLKGTDEDEARAGVVQEVSGLITTLVHSEQWTDNGGDRASLTHYGSKLFVKAPKRFQPQIQWILAEVGSGEAGAEPRQAWWKNDSAPDRSVVHSYPIKHIAAENALKALKALESIRRIDFSPFAIDPRTNSVVGKALPAEHELIAQALTRIDNPERPAAEARAAELKAMGDELHQRLDALAARRAAAEDQLLNVGRQSGDSHRTVKEIQAAVDELRQQEETVRDELSKLESPLKDKRPSPEH